MNLEILNDCNTDSGNSKLFHEFSDRARSESVLTGLGLSLLYSSLGRDR